MTKYFGSKQRSLFVPRRSTWATLGLISLYLLGAAIGIGALVAMFA